MKANPYKSRPRSYVYRIWDSQQGKVLGGILMDKRKDAESTCKTLNTRYTVKKEYF